MRVQLRIFRTFRPLEKELKYQLEALLRESCQFNANDILVHIDPDNKKVVQTDGIELTFHHFPNALLREAEKTRKEAGVNSLCLVKGIVELPVGSRKVSSPAFMIPLSWTRDRVRDEIRFETDDEAVFLNPYLELQLEQLDIPFKPEDDFKTFCQLLHEHGLNVLSDQFFIGNFHHHRYQVIRELEELLELENPSPRVRQILGFDTKPPFPISLPKGQLFAADTDHEHVFATFPGHDLVVQGPPGTGKSQVLTNMVAKLLGGGQTCIVVSEKRAALEVIRKKLGMLGLDKLSFIATSDHLSHAFLQELKSCWDYFENNELKPVTNLYLSEQYLDNLQMTLDLLSQPELIGGVSFHEFREIVGNTDLDAFVYSSDTLSVKELVQSHELLRELYAAGLSTVLGHLRLQTLNREKLLKLDAQIENWLTQLRQVKEHFPMENWHDLELAMRKAALCQVYENELYKRHASIFRLNSREQRKFLKLRKNYLKTKAELERYSSNQSHWNQVPSATETKGLIEMFENGGFLTRRKALRRWKKITHLPASRAVDVLREHLLITDTLDHLSQITVEFCDLGIDDPSQQVEVLYQALHLYPEDQWRELEAIPEEERLQLTQQHALLNRLYHDLRNHFRLNGESAPTSFLKELQQQLPQLIERRADLEQISENTLRAIARNKDFSALRGEVLRSHLTAFRERFPEFSKFEVSDIHKKVQAVLNAEEEEFGLFAREIEWRCKQQFIRYHELLNTPARKLSEEEKALKATLRKGKALLVKEFGKTRSHPTLRELYHSEARPWIQLLKPVWLSNPVQLAKCFPMEENLFDVAIFDEASQIPLQHALGTLHRAKRCLIAGDEQQMGPASYFRSGPSEPIDLLHQAAYQLERVPLQHHYRSVHPDLIRFSNEHFYEGRLRAYPSAATETPIHYHFTGSGQFIDRKNPSEARAVAKQIHDLLKQKGSIGVVAFSEEQLQCIHEALSSEDQALLQERVDESLGFFKALENVQGDECDHLVVSFGYAPNESGEFHLRFGPMNTANGRKRLNVLLTRAIRTIDFFASVKSRDFALSDNESVNLLRQWLTFAENYTEKPNADFPFGLEPERQENKLTFLRVHETLPQAREVVTLQRVLENRGWTVSYS